MRASPPRPPRSAGSWPSPRPESGRRLPGGIRPRCWPQRRWSRRLDLETGSQVGTTNLLNAVMTTGDLAAVRETSFLQDCTFGPSSGVRVLDGSTAAQIWETPDCPGERDPEVVRPLRVRRPTVRSGV